MRELCMIIGGVLDFFAGSLLCFLDFGGLGFFVGV